MNWDRIEVNWEHFKGNARQQWGKLTDDQFDTMAGKRHNLAGRIQETDGITKYETEKQPADNTLKDLAQCGDVGTLGSALRALCSEFGSVSRLDILTMINAGKRRAVCILRLDSSEQKQDLMTKFGASRFGEDLCVVVDMKMPDRAQA